MALNRDRLDPGDLVSVVRDYASLCDSRGNKIRTIPIDSLGVVIAYNSKIGSYFVSWDFGRSGWVLRDNLCEVTA